VKTGYVTGDLLLFKVKMAD